MKRVVILSFTLLFFLSGVGLASAQTIVRLGDLPKSEYVVSIYQIVGFQEGFEGYRLTYIDEQNELNYLYLPAAMRGKFEVYKPRLNTAGHNFVILWRKGGKIDRVQWYMPEEIDYKLPQYVTKEFGEKDKEIFQAIVDKGEFVLGTDIGGIAPVIRAPGGGE
ncbi:MAG: hypothetical protein JSV25_09980 [Spirochaetota bacterium]|nr:MAG: hypothetical protein JSV25_09980 [Spirochaetota bacterium]